MNMNKFVIDVLKPIGIPVYFATNTGDASEYLVFNVWEIPSLHADDREHQITHMVQIDIFTPDNFLPIADDVKNRMIDAGFMRVFENPADYIEEVKLFRKTFRFSYTTKN